ncbi:MAG: type II secretion system major pseudopilin GspG [Candidatus Methylomirabilis oxyfera]|nr:type II secretion system major pseudopilin GspG [Candidatus Methylomirabilis oxyfera]
MCGVRGAGYTTILVCGTKELSVGIQRVEEIEARQEARARTLRRNQAGFTLIELLVVIIIIGLLAALVGPKLFGRVGKGKQAAAQAQIELLGAALDNFRLDVGRYPTSDEGLKALLVNPGGIENWDGPYLKKQEIPVDPWTHAYVYKSPGEHGDYDILSFGGDGVPGGEGENQDIVSWQGIKRAGAGEKVE